jgi:hypothetical protein
VPTYVAECYLSRANGEELDAAVERLAAASASLSESSPEMLYVQALYVPGDELCLHIFRAASEDLVVAAAAEAGLRHVRVTEAREALPTAHRVLPPSTVKGESK